MDRNWKKRLVVSLMAVTMLFNNAPLSGLAVHASGNEGVIQSSEGIEAAEKQSEAKNPPITYYTVTYKDGANGDVFDDDVHTDLAEGSSTPEFSGSTNRDGYEFDGWNPGVSKTVQGNAVYTATWSEVEPEETDAASESDAEDAAEEETITGDEGSESGEYEGGDQEISSGENTDDGQVIAPADSETTDDEQGTVPVDGETTDNEQVIAPADGETTDDEQEIVPADGENTDDEQAIASEDDTENTEEKEDSSVKNNTAKKAGDSEEAAQITVRFNPNTEPDGILAYEEIQVPEGEAIGDQLPAVPEVPGYTTKWVKEGTTEEVTAETVVTEPFTAVVGKEKITYTVTFVQEDGTEETRTTDIDAGFAVNDLPEVAHKDNKIGRWVYQDDRTKEFTVGTVIRENVTVISDYTQNIFTVKFMVDGNPYEEMTTAAGMQIILPSEPIKPGTTFKGWYTEPDGQGTEYTEDSTVNEDLTLYAFFEGQVRVRFIVKDDDGSVISEKSQYFVDLSVGDQITTLPDDPFMEGKQFDHWENENTGETVEIGTTVTESFDAVAVFSGITTYKLTVHYYYMKDGGEVTIQDPVFSLLESDFPYTVTAPATAVAEEIAGEPVYYPSQPTITVTKDEFDDDHTLTVSDEYVAPNAQYKVGHYLERLSGDGYDLIETEQKTGVRNSEVTPEINSYSYAIFEDRDKDVVITGDAGQELKVYYTRREFTLSYNVGEGDYIPAETKPYETKITLPRNAAREGYTFAGWFTDPACTQSAENPYELKDNTTLYAKWNAAQSDYKIVYMIENADDDGYSYLATVTKQAPTGSIVTMTAQTAGASGTRPRELDTTNFTFKDSTTETIKADGTSVVTVRYSRNVYTLVSRSNGYSASVTAKFGSDITQAWTSQFNRYDGSWSYNNQNNSKFKSLTIMPSLSVRTNTSPANTIYVYHHDDSASYYQHLEYWLQNYEDGDATTTYNGKTYGRVKAIDMRYNYLSNVDDWYEITGYSKAGYTAEHRRYQNSGTWQSFTYSWGTRFSNYGNQYTYTRFNFYYDAEKYPLTFYNYDGTQISTQQVTLGDNISTYLIRNIPEAPMEGAEWLGWYTDQEHTSPYSGGTKMPAGLVLYGAFQFPTRTVTFDAQGGSAVEAETDEYGFTATKPADPTKDHYTFQGWFTAADETGSSYDWHKPVTEDITLYAHWTQDTIKYTVHYYEKGTTTKLLEDKTVSDPDFVEGQEITENAPTVAGHLADKASVTKKLSFDEEENTIIFYYDAVPDEITYVVNYVLKDHPKIKVAESKTVTVPGTTSNVLEMAVAADHDYIAAQTSDEDILGKHYRPTENTKEQQLAIGNNVITFEYVPLTTSKITVHYYDMDGNSIYATDVTYVEKGDTFTLQNKSADGYVYHHAYLDGTTTAPEPTYQITENIGDLVINIYYQKKLIIIANNKSKVYDGTALYSEGLGDVTVTGAMRGDKLTGISFDGSQTDAGTSTTTPKNAVITKGADAVGNPEAYYSIIYVPGSLTVKPVSVFINITADQWNTHSGSDGGPNYYTGNAFDVGFTNESKQHFNDDTSKSAYVNITSARRDLFKSKYGDAIWSALYGENGALISEKDAGYYTYSGAQQREFLSSVIVDGQRMMSDPNYSITFYARDCFLKIEPLPLTISTGSDSKEYDGTPLTKTDDAKLSHNYWTENVGGEWKAAPDAPQGQITLGTGDTITLTVTGTQTAPGSSDNTYSIDWGATNPSNYKIKETVGTLEVTNRAVTITAKSDDKVYDGTPLTNTGYEFDGLADGDSIESVAVTGSQTAVGTSDNVPGDAKIVNADGEDVTEYYKITYVKGTLEVTKKPVTITADSDTKVYDGSPLTKDSFTYTALAIGHNFKADSVTVSGSQTAVGTSNNVPGGGKIVDGDGNDVTSNYEIKYTNGTLEVTGKAVTITANSDTKVYDGTALTNSGYTNTGLAEGDRIDSVTVTGSQTRVGESANVPSAAKIVNSSGEDVTANYVITYNNGLLKVTLNQSLIITADSDTKVYDGTPLTKDSYQAAGLAAGDSIESVTVTGSQTVVGTSDNVPSAAVIRNAAGEDVTESYKITYKNGTLEVTKKSVTITADSGTKVYDGTALTKDSFTNTDLAVGDSVDSVIVTGSQTAVGTSNNVPSEAKIVNADGEDVTASYEITYVNGSLEVTKKSVTITADSDTKVYDGTALTKDSYTNTELAEGDTIDAVTITGSQTIVGTSDNVPSTAKIVNADGEDVTASYEITYAKGTLEVTKKSATITAGSDTKEYDGTALTKDSYITTDLAAGDSIDSVTVTGSQTIVGTSDNVPSAAIIVNTEGDDVTASYEIIYVNGTLEVTQKVLTITAGSGTKIYDGTPLTNSTYKSTGLASGDTIESVTVTGSQTAVGTSDNVPSEAKIVNAAGEDVTDSYKITYKNGILEVTKKAVTITADSDTKVYDGTELTKDSYSNTDLAPGDQIDSATITGSQTAVGISDNVPSEAKIVNAAGEDVTASYEITYENGTLEVTKKAVTITADNATKEYDGTELTKDSYTNTELAEGDVIDSVTITGSQTIVGTSDNTPSEAKILNDDGQEVTANYEITYANGTLEVTKKVVTITADSDTKVYDGTPLTKNSYTHTELAEGDSIESVTVTGSRTFFGESENVPSDAIIKNKAGEDVTASYEILYVNGTLIITLNEAVTITADSGSKVYDGTALTKDSYQVAGLAAGDTIESVTITGSQTVVGNSDNVPSKAKIVNADGEDVTASYAITYANGTLEVTRKVVTITAGSDTKVYDGTTLTKDSYKSTALAEGDSIDSVTVTGSQTVVGSSDNVPSAAVIKNAAGEDVTSSYEITYANGSLEVTKKAVTITADSDTKVYDGTALTKDSYKSTALAAGDAIDSVTITGSQTVVGRSGNIPSAAVIRNAAGEDVTSSYEITYANGELEVTPKELTITAGSDTKVYDGTPLTKDSYTNTSLAAGDSMQSVAVTGSQTVVGKSDNVPSKAKIVNSDGEDVTNSYKITYVNGSLEVTKKTVTITADSDTKVYDGAALTKDSYKNTQLADGDTIDSVTITGSQTVVGSSDNVPSTAVIKNADGEVVTDSYEIMYVIGSLEVTKKAVTITADSDTKVYDGTALTKDSYTNTELAAGDSIESVTVTGSQTVVGSSDNVPSEAKIVNANGEDVTANYEITYANGTLVVTLNQALIITADSDTKVYDGSPLTKNSYQAAGLAAGDSIESVTITGSQTVVGSSDNVPSEAKIVNADGVDVTASYEITYAKGKLEVTKKAVTITADSDEKVYDGSALTEDSYTNTELAAGESIVSVTVTGSQTVVGSSDNVPSEAKIVNADGVDVTSSYEITYKNGTLEVTQKAVTITAGSDSKVYDGTALTNSTYSSTDLASGDTITSITVTGSQTMVGTNNNVPSAAVIKNAAGEDVTASYRITYENGTLEVTKKAVTITADSDTKVYDGSPLTTDDYQAAGLASGDKITSITVTGSQTAAGSSSNVPSAAKIVNEAGEDVTASYEITYANGTLEVTKKAVTITADSDTKVYDGTELTKDSYTHAPLAEGDSIDSVIVKGSQTAVGSSDNVPSAAKIVNEAGEDVTASYEISYVNGSLEVTKKAVTITADSDTKVYDGTPLTKNSYSNTDLASGDRIESVTVTGSRTFFGTSENVPSDAIIKNAAGEDVTGNYDIAYVNGTLTITLNEAVTITADSDSKVYDGSPLTKNSYQAAGLAEGDRVEAVTITGSQTTVGKSYNVPSAAKIVNAKGEDVTASYAITYANGELEVTKKAVMITADSDTKVYDGTALTKDSYKNTDLAEDDSIDSVTITGSQTIAGKSENVPSAVRIVNADGVDVTASYEITCMSGTLEVTKKAVTITAGSDTKVYDGTALTKDSYKNTDLAEGDSIDSVTITGSQTVVGKSDNVPSAAKIVNAAGEDVTASYEITYANGSLEVTKMTLTITADSDSKVYDGTALTKDSFTNTVLAQSDRIESVTITGSQTEVGTSDNVPSAAKIVNAAGEDVTKSYNITYANGILEVTKKAVTITANSDTKVYDGTALTNSGYTNTGLAAGDSIETVIVTGSQTAVGTSNNVPSAAKIVNADGKDVTDSYKITYIDGSLTVTKKAVTITADSDTKTYDGRPLTKNSYQAAGLAAGDSVEAVTVSGSQTEAGTSDNVPSAAKIVNADGEDVTTSYEITYAKGTLEVTKKTVTITADSDTKVYDGTALTKDSYTKTELAEGDSVDSITVTGSQTVVGSSDNVPSAAKIVNADGEDVTGSYEITYANGTLEVTKKSLTITADSGSKVYDGTALTMDSYTNTELAEGDSIDSVTITGSQTMVGSSDNVPSAARIINNAGRDVTDNYDIAYKNGILEVTLNESLIITADSATKVYDGSPLTIVSYQVAGLAEGDSVESVTVTGSQTEAGTSDNVPSAAKIVNADGEDVTESYTITYVNGELEVTKKAVTIIADSDSKVYDGTALTKDSYTNTALAEGDSIESVTVTGSQTEAGTSDNIPSAAKIVNADGEDVTASYEITYVSGTLEVTKKTLTITADSDSKVYDGTALTRDSYTNTSLAEGDSVESVTVTGSQTEAGTSDNVPSAAKIVNVNGEDVTASYEITYKNGTLEVTKKAVTITADSGEKVYDGTALTKDSYTNTELAAGDSIESVTVTGSQIAAGSSDNIPSAAKIVNAAGVDVTASYEITYVNGTLEVTQKAVTITAGSDKKIYDGTALTNSTYKNTSLAAGDSIVSVTVTGSQTAAGTSSNAPSAAKIVNAAGEDVTASYKITYENGTLEVTKKAVTITADSDKKVYDGSPLTKNSYTNTALASGDSIDSVTITGSQTVVGSSDNVPGAAVIKNADGEDVTASYEITYVNGTLEVTGKAVTITADSDTKVYDGTPLTKDSYTYTALAVGDSFDSVTVTGSQTVAGSSDNVPSGAKIINADGEDVTESYEITYANGSLEVTRKVVTITADSATKVYDGTPLTKDSYTNTALASGDSIESVKVSGSRTFFGESDNVPSDAVIKNEAGEDVTGSYEIVYVNGALVITLNVSAIITADSESKVYDGTALTKNSYQVEGLAKGDRIETVTVTGSQTAVGTSNNVPSEAKIVNAKGEDVTDSYKITYINGSLTVTKKAVTITADSDTKVYDGTALTKDSYTNTALAEGDSIESVIVTGSQTAVGTSDNVPSEAVIRNANGDDVTGNYDITYAKGTLAVTKKAVTITADSDTKVYDGTELTKDSYKNTSLADGDSIESVTVTGSRIVVGISDNVPSEAVIRNSGGDDVTGNYDITYVSGTLEVTKKPLTITADSGEKVYDGTALTKGSYMSTGLAAGDSFDIVTITGSQTVVGTSSNVPSAAKIVNADGEDVTASYEITYANGTLEVTKKPLTITADSDEKVYDGTALTKESYTSTGLATGDKVESVIVSGSQIVVGKSNNVPGAAKIVNADGEDVTASYEITYANGALEVTKKSLTITADSDTKVYDGTPLTKDSYTNTALAEGDRIDSVTITGSQTVVGESNNVPSSAKILNTSGEDMTANYEITYKNGLLKVTLNKSLIITADSDTKVYDGTALIKNSYKAAGLADGDSVETVTVTGSQTVVGTSNNIPSAAKIVNAKGDDVTASYEITYVNGTLEVTKKVVTITAESDTKVYDGTALTNSSYENTALAAGDTVESVTVTGSRIVVGISDNVPSAAKIVNAEGDDVTASYEITYVNGTLEVTKKVVTITAESDTKVYDGTALTNSSFENTALADGDTIESVTVTGSQTVAGKSNNVPSAAKIVNANGENVTESYGIIYANGTLEVTKKAVTITADNDTKVYDGTPLTKDSYTNTALASDDSIESVAVTGSQTMVGKSDNVPSAAVIRNAAGEDVTDSYEITYEKGELEVTKKAVMITADSDVKVYDGTALTNNGYTNTGLAAGDNIESVTVTGSQTDAGESDNVPSEAKIVNNAGRDVTANYEITYMNGSLKVTKKAMTIIAGSAAKVYDGTPLTKDSFTNTDLSEGDIIESVTVTGSRTIFGTSDNIPSDAVIKNGAGKDVTGNYEITYVNGTLTITLNDAVIITADSDSKVYDGTALTKNSYNAVGLAEGDSIESVTVTGSQTFAGESANVPSAAKIVNSDGEDVTDSYKIKYVNGSLKVTPKSMTITADSDTKVYDGKALTKDSFKAVGLVVGDSVEFVTVTGSQTTAGKSDNVPSAAKIVNAEGEDVTASYEITYVKGELEVTKKPVTITAGTDTKVYDGTPLTKNTYSSSDLAEGDDFDSVIVTGSQTDVGKSDNVLRSAVIRNAAGRDVTESYSITYVNGTLEVTPMALIITADSDEKEYDGRPLTKNSYTNSELAKGDSILTVTVTGSQTLVGTSNNVPSAAKIVNVHGDEVTANYDIKYVNGTLTVNDRTAKYEIEVVSKGGEEKYDGKEKTVSDFETLTFEVEGNTYTVEGLSASGSGTDAGTYPNKISGSPVVKDAEGNDVTRQFTVNQTDGNLVIEPRKVTLTSAEGSKLYDGTPLTKNEQTDVTAGGDGFVEGEGASYDITGSQTLVGSSENTFTYTLKDNTKAENYEITMVNGILEVVDHQGGDTPRPDLVVTKTADDKEYALGETVWYTITVTNIYDKVQTVRLREIDGVELPKSEFELEPGETYTLSYDKDPEEAVSHVITEADILNGGFTNIVTAEVGNVEAAADAAVNTKKNNSLKVEKEMTSVEPENGYALGDTIKYKITVTNDGNVTISDIKVNDELTGMKKTVKSLAPGESKEFTTSYTVTEQDFRKGSVTNVATAKGTDPDNLTTSGEDEVVVDLKLYKITYVLNGGIYNGSTDDIVEIYCAGEVITIHEAPTREGYVFDYWEGSEYQPGDKYTVFEDHVFTAQWKKDVKPDDDNGKKDNSGGKRGSARTGDLNDPMLWLMLLIASLAGLSGAYTVRRRKSGGQ